MMTRDERRESRRVDATLKAIISNPIDGREFSATIRNRSAAGVMAECLVPPPVGTKLLVTIESEEPVPALVVWKVEGRIGLKFITGSDSD